MGRQDPYHRCYQNLYVHETNSMISRFIDVRFSSFQHQLMLFINNNFSKLIQLLSHSWNESKLFYWNSDEDIYLFRLHTVNYLAFILTGTSISITGPAFTWYQHSYSPLITREAQVDTNQQQRAAEVQVQPLGAVCGSRTLWQEEVRSDHSCHAVSCRLAAWCPSGELIGPTWYCQ